MDEDLIGNWGPPGTVAHEEMEKTQDGMIWRSHSCHHEEDLLSWWKPCTWEDRCPKVGEVVSFFGTMLINTVPHTRMHSSTLIMEVVLCSEFLVPMYQTTGDAMAQLVDKLRYKPEGRGFDSRWYYWNFSNLIIPAALRPWGWLSLRSISWGEGGMDCRCVPIVLKSGSLNLRPCPDL